MNEECMKYGMGCFIISVLFICSEVRDKTSGNLVTTEM